MKRLLKTYTLLLALLLGCIPAMAQTQEDDEQLITLSGAELTSAAKRVTSSYSDWKTLQLSGNITLPGIPVRPSVKVWMERNKQIIISMRAPFVGEVATVDIQPDTFCIVNKMNKTYVRESLQKLIAGIPVSIGNVQDLLLGRAFVPGAQTLSMDNYTLMNFFLGESLYIIPTAMPAHLNITCGFVADPATGQLRDIVLEDNADSNFAQASYSYQNKQTIINLLLRVGGKDRDIKLVFDAPSKKGNPLKPAEIGSNYRQVSLSKFMRSLR